MTILDQITREAEALSPKERKRVLKLIRSVRPTKKIVDGTKPAVKNSIDKRKLHPALRAIVGMWKDRTDLPKDGAAASKVLRRRVMGRHVNG